MLRGLTVSTQRSGDAGYIVAKMARLLVIAVIEPGNERKHWGATQLHVNGGAWGVDDYRVPPWLIVHLRAAAQAQQDAVDGLSDRQKQLTNAALMKAIEMDPVAVARSGSVRAFEADLELFGPGVFQASVDDDRE